MNIIYSNKVQKYYVPSQKNSDERSSKPSDPIRLTEWYFAEYIPETANQKQLKRWCRVCSRKSANGKVKSMENQQIEERRLWC